MDGFKRPNRPETNPGRQPDSSLPPVIGQPQTTQQFPGQVTPQAPAEIINNELTVLPPVQNTPSVGPSSPFGLKPRKKHKLWLYLLVSFITLIVIVLCAMIWYNEMLEPVDKNNKVTQQVKIGEGASFGFVSERLKSRGLIKNNFVFRVFAYLDGKDKQLKQGECSLAPNESAREILDKLTSGCQDFRSVTFFPGGTIEKPTYDAPEAKDFSVKNALLKAGFLETDVKRALTAKYSGDLFADKPDGTSLEGYVYGDTFYMNTTDGPDLALKESFAEMLKVIKKNDLVAGFKAQKLNLYQGITLASIVQRELSCDNLKPEKLAICHENQQKIAQVFLTRSDMDMPLGSDVTYMYGAGLTGQTPTPSLDSPYNTRIHKGLPPGPIASPGEYAMRAVAKPATTNYLYFVAGDEGGGAVYFATTLEGHESNIKNHCQKLCNM